MKGISFTIPIGLLREVDQFVNDDGYGSRSMLMRYALRWFLVGLKKKKEEEIEIHGSILPNQVLVEDKIFTIVSKNGKSQENF